MPHIREAWLDVLEFPPRLEKIFSSDVTWRLWDRTS